MKYLVVVAVLIITGLLSKHTDPQHINKQVTRTSEKHTQVASVKQEQPKQATVTQPQVVQENTVTPIVTSTASNCDAYDALIAENFGAENLITAKAVMRAESSCRADAVGDNHITYVQDGTTYGMSCGLWQIRYLPGRPSCEEMKDPAKSTAYAATLFRANGWKPWAAWSTGAYLRFK